MVQEIRQRPRHWPTSEFYWIAFALLLLPVFINDNEDMDMHIVRNLKIYYETFYYMKSDQIHLISQIVGRLSRLTRTRELIDRIKASTKYGL